MSNDEGMTNVGRELAGDLPVATGLWPVRKICFDKK